MLNGILFAFLSSLLAFIWFNDIQIALIMGVAMITNLLIAGILGTLIPLTLERYKIDPAISSSVFLTTVTDVIGFFSWLSRLGYFIIKYDSSLKKKLAVGISSIENLKDRQSFIFDTYGEIINFTRINQNELMS